MSTLYNQHGASFPTHDGTSPSNADASSSSASSRFASHDPTGRQGGHTLHAPVRGRIPATIEASLVATSQTTRQAFADALARDQRAALQPLYGTPFRSANDVVQRLLPYHVWNIRDADVLHVLRIKDDRRSSASSEKQLSSEPEEIADATSTDQSNVRSRRPHKRRLAHTLSAERVSKIYPSEDEARSLWERYIVVHARAKRLRRNLIENSTVSSPAPFVQESLYHLENAAWEHERELFLKGQENLRLAREQAIAAGVTWEAIMRVTSGRPEAIDGQGQEDASTSSDSSSRSDESSSKSDDDDDDIKNSGDVGNEDGDVDGDDGEDEGNDEDGEGEVDESSGADQSVGVGRQSPAAKPAVPSPVKANVQQAASALSSPLQHSTLGSPRNSSSASYLATSAGSTPAQASTGKPNLTTVAGATQPLRRGRGRPRKERDEHGKIIRTPAMTQILSASGAMGVAVRPSAASPTSSISTAKPVNVITSTVSFGSVPSVQTSASQQRPLILPTSSSSVQPDGYMATDAASTAASATSASGPSVPGSASAAAAATAIPTQPIRLALPLSAIERLTSLAIALVPAPHLQAAFAARQMTSVHQGTSAEDVLAVLGRIDAAPRPPPVQQQDAALLLGMTSAPPLGSASQAARPAKPALHGQQQQDDHEEVRVMHVSVILSKLGPSQLSGLAALMQDVQQSAKPRNS